MNKYLKIFASIAVSVLFLWLAFKGVEFSEIVEASKDMSWAWVIPFFIVTLFSHFIRAERWRMLFNDGGVVPHRSTLFTGVMFGYLGNIVFPRLGEITRPVYVARQVGESNSKLIGTIVLERVIDVVSMLTIAFFVGIFLVSDVEVLSRLFGVDFSDPTIVASLLKGLLLYGGIAVLFCLALFFILKKLSQGEGAFPRFVSKVRESAQSFVQGILSIKKLKNWPLFVFYTAIIWISYITMTYIPFWMFDMHEVFDLTYADAVILTMVSAVGIAIPTPGGVGSYHYFIMTSLLVLYAVPEATGLAFATIAHAATLVLVVITSPILLAMEKYLALKRESKG